MKILPWYLAYALGLTAALGGAGHRSRAASGSGPSRPRPKRILVVGGTGGTGRELIAQGLERGYQITALVRNAAALSEFGSRVAQVQGDVRDPVSVDRAMTGVDAVVSALGHKKFFGPSNLLSEGTGHMLAAMKAHQVRKLICVTSLGLGNSAGRMGLLYTLFVLPVVLPFYFWDKTRQERRIAQSDLDWVIVRPGRLTDAPARGQIRHGINEGNYLMTQSISRADVAAFMLDQLESDGYLRAAPGVVG